MSSSVTYVSRASLAANDEVSSSSSEFDSDVPPATATATAMAIKASHETVELKSSLHRMRVTAKGDNDVVKPRASLGRGAKAKTRTDVVNEKRFGAAAASASGSAANHDVGPADAAVVDIFEDADEDKNDESDDDDDSLHGPLDGIFTVDVPRDQKNITIKTRNCKEKDLGPVVPAKLSSKKLPAPTICAGDAPDTDDEPHEDDGEAKNKFVAKFAAHMTGAYYAVAIRSVHENFRYFLL